MAFVVRHLGRPVATAPDADTARAFVYRNADKLATHTVSWTSTGKFLVDGSWSGWELGEVPAL